MNIPQDYISKTEDVADQVSLEPGGSLWKFFDFGPEPHRRNCQLTAESNKKLEIFGRDAGDQHIVSVCMPSSADLRQMRPANPTFTC
jgi:hypothetical protein